MSINIFQFLKQGTSLNRKSIETNKQLEEKITPKIKTPNLMYYQTGKFNQSDEQPMGVEQGNEWEELDEEKMKHKHNKDMQKSIDSRKKYHIKVEGTDVPFVANNFGAIAKRYKIDAKLMENIAEMGLKKPTPVQMQAIPALLEDRNVLVTAPTGTGKTLSYLFPIVQNIMRHRQEQQNKAKSKNKKQANKKQKPKQRQYNNIQAIIIAPQQQLSTQIVHELANLVKQSQRQTSKHLHITFQCISLLTEEQKLLLQECKPIGVNILVSTPQIFLNTFTKDPKQINLLSKVKYIVLDECDKYFEQSFLEQVRNLLQIFATIKPKPVYGLFSATIQHPVEELLKSELLDDALRIQVGGKNRVINSIEQTIQYCTNQYGKLLQLKNMIAQNQFVPPALIFVQQKTRTKQLLFEMKKILKNGPGGMDISKKVQTLSGEKSKEERKQILQKFEKGTLWVLITTDLIARGIDFSHVNLVINYDFPNSMLTYIHRVGRTGRAERQGKAVTFFTEQDKPIVRSLANLLHASGCTVPQWILQLPKADRKTKKKLQKFPVKRLPVGVAQGRDKNFDKQLQKMQKVWKRKRQKQVQKQQKHGQNKGDQQQSGQWIQA